MTRLASWCFQCRMEYDPEVAECVECAVPTIGHFPVPPHEVGSEDDEQLAYELHSWAGERRASVEEALHRQNVAHGWQGPTLIVLVDDEEAVDAIIDEFDDSEGDADAADVDSPDGMVAIPVGASTELQDELLGILTEEEVEHELLPSGFLLIPNEYETAVTELFEELQEDYRGTATFGDGVEGVEANTVVEQIFLATSTLRKSTRDIRAYGRMAEATDLAHQLKLPFGFEAPMWRSVLDRSRELCDLIENNGDDEEIESLAGSLRDL